MKVHNTDRLKIACLLLKMACLLLKIACLLMMMVLREVNELRLDIQSALTTTAESTTLDQIGLYVNMSKEEMVMMSHNITNQTVEYAKNYTMELIADPEAYEELYNLAEFVIEEANKNRSGAVVISKGGKGEQVRMLVLVVLVVLVCWCWCWWCCCCW